MATKSQIKFLKSEIKRLGALRRKYKNSTRYNTSEYYHQVWNPFLKKLKSGEVEKHSCYPWNNQMYIRNSVYKELYQNYCQNRKEVEKLDFGFPVWEESHNLALTAAHVLYNEIRGKKSHLSENTRMKRYLYDWFIAKWIERMECVEEERENSVL